MKEKVLQKYSKSAADLSYSGDITFKVLDNNRVLFEKQYHNHGCSKLFNFITDCLAGNFTAAQSNRPCRIVLFRKDSSENQTTFKAQYWNDDYKISTKVFYDSVTPSNSDSSVLTYHFRVPFLCLVGGETIGKIGLYPDIITSLSKDICAFYVLKDNETVQIPTTGGNLTIVVD